METTLIIFVLSIQSSYLNNSEMPATENKADTIQFFITPETAWRIKTFATDEDVHVHSIGTPKQDIVSIVTASTERTYGDVIAHRYVLSSSNGIIGLRGELKRAGLGESMEVSQKGFVFSVPECTNYKSKPTPSS